MFKKVDTKLKEIGFAKTKENEYGVSYERKDEKYNYIQVLDLLHKASGRHLIQSYQKDVNKDGFNNVVGLTAYETKLALKKMRQIGLR